MTGKFLNVESSSFWFKVVEMVQHNWAVILSHDEGVQIVFFGDTSDIFDRMEFSDAGDAERALRRNGFAIFDDDPEVQSFIAKPEPRLQDEPFYHRPIYSSGQFWR
ncbi:hypothetical protein [Parasphingorhabdus sp.]|uniref:hypothetical protein n=1 Tax=Parasphingorhabdus sp. TaxID=2709688 RepID=UPI002F94FE14